MTAKAVTHIPERWDEQGRKYAATADDAAYGIFELEGDVIAQINSSWAVRVDRGELVEFQVDGTHGSAVAGLFGCRIQPRVRTPMPVWNPDLPTTEDFRSQWEQIPDNAEFTNGFRAQWEQFLSDVDAGRPHALRPRRRRARLAAGRRRPDILGRRPPGRDRPVRVMTTTTATVALPEAGGGWREIELSEPRAWAEHPAGFRAAGSPSPRRTS